MPETYYDGTRDTLDRLRWLRAITRPETRKEVVSLCRSTAQQVMRVEAQPQGHGPGKEVPDSRSGGLLESA